MVITKWADYCISQVIYDPGHLLIERVLVYEDKGEKFGVALSLKRSEIIEKIKKGFAFITMTLGTNGWNKGAKVFIVTINREEYIKTRPDDLTRDNLGELPEM
jgi:hypothetical protein